MTNKLKIGLIGYGKMGKTIEDLAVAKGHEIKIKTNSQNPIESQVHLLDQLDVAIEFTSPELAANNLEILAQNKVPTVCGSTAWLDDYDRICELYNANQTAFLYASNFSIGVNLFFALNKHLAQLMEPWSAYTASMTESHHVTKKDAPSGTAVSLAEDLIANHDSYKRWHLEGDNNEAEESLKIKAIREADVKGMHSISYKSDIDEITITHDAYSRKGFASGALMASEWIQGREGIFSMKDILKL